MLDELSELINHFKPEEPSRFAKPPEAEHVPFFSAEDDPDFAIYEREFFKDKAIDRRTIEITPEEAAERRSSMRKILQASIQDGEKGLISQRELIESVKTIKQQSLTLGLTMRERYNLSHNLNWKKEVLSPSDYFSTVSKAPKASAIQAIPTGTS